MKKVILFPSDTIKFSQFPEITLEKKELVFKTTKKSFFPKAFLLKDTKTFFTKTDNKLVLFSSFCKNQKKNGFFFEVFLYGLNFSAKRLKLYKKPFYIDVHRSHRKIFFERKSSLFKTRIYKRRLLFFSFYKSIMNEIFKILRPYRPLNIYTGKGLLLRGDKYKTKRGKKKRP